MSSPKLVLRPGPELQYHLEQWYYREAALLDNRQYQSWLALIDPEIRYSMPARSNPMVDNRLRGQESMLSVEHELEGIDSDGCPIRDENYAYLFLRVERSYKANSWAENPPARTRRIIGNIQLLDIDAEQGLLQLQSNFHLHYARPGMNDAFFAGQRRDELKLDGAELRLRQREILLDMDEIHYPTLGLFL